MNILREVRRVSNKSMPVRIIFLLAFAVMFIVTTYAWFSTQKDIDLGGLEGGVTSWDVSYIVNEDEDVTLDRTYAFELEQLYPGMTPYEEYVHIYNIGEASTNIDYKLVSVKVFGQEVISQLDSTVRETTITDENGVQKTVYQTTLFSGDSTYPFSISYTYDKNYLNGKYDEDDPVTSESAHATLTFNASWEYEGDDTLDTQFGKDAYEYYYPNGVDDLTVVNDPSKAIEIQVKITSSMIHPSLEAE